MPGVHVSPRYQYFQLCTATRRSCRDAPVAFKIMRIALIISLILLCSVPCFAQQSDTPISRPSVPDSVKDLLERAAKLSQAGRGRLAITLIQEAIKISPDSPALHLALGNEL